jgi:hypothetical protein
VSGSQKHMLGHPVLWADNSSSSVSLHADRRTSTNAQRECRCREPLTVPVTSWFIVFRRLCSPSGHRGSRGGPTVGYTRTCTPPTRHLARTSSPTFLAPTRVFTNRYAAYSHIMFVNYAGAHPPRLLARNVVARLSTLRGEDRSSFDRMVACIREGSLSPIPLRRTGPRLRPPPHTR